MDCKKPCEVRLTVTETNIAQRTKCYSPLRSKESVKLAKKLIQIFVKIKLHGIKLHILLCGRERMSVP